MFLQGNLQVVFDALYNMGVIDPVLEMDWNEALDKMPMFCNDIERAVQVANKNQSNMQMLIFELEKFDANTLSYLAMEVARELADFHSREELH